MEVEEGGKGDGDAPRGRLSKGQIEKRQAVLASLRADLDVGKKSSVGELSAKYHTLIPTVVGRQAAPALSTLGAVTEKKKLLKFMLRMGFEVEEADTGLSHRWHPRLPFAQESLRGCFRRHLVAQNRIGLRHLEA